MTALLLILFPADGLASPRWEDREAATRFAGRLWPLTEPGLRALGTRDPEVAARATAARYAGAGRLFGPGWQARWDALVLVLDPHEIGGLPWASPGMHAMGRFRPELRSALGDLAEYAGWKPTSGGRFVFAPAPIPLDPAWSSWDRLLGLDELRFVARGMSLPPDWTAGWVKWSDTPLLDAIVLWNKRKATGKYWKFPEPK